MVMSRAGSVCGRALYYSRSPARQQLLVVRRVDSAVAVLAGGICVLRSTVCTVLYAGAPSHQNQEVMLECNQRN